MCQQTHEDANYHLALYDEIRLLNQKATAQ